MGSSGACSWRPRLRLPGERKTAALRRLTRVCWLPFLWGLIATVAAVVARDREANTSMTQGLDPKTHPELNQPLRKGFGDSVSFTVATALMPVVINFALLRFVSGFYGYAVVAVTGATISIIKNAFGCPRPNYFALVADGQDVRAASSFPSQHSGCIAASMVFAVLDWVPAVQAEWPAVRSLFSFFPVLPCVILLCFSVPRYTSGFHHTTDIVAGWLIGSLWAAYLASQMNTLARLRARDEKSAKECGDGSVTTTATETL